MRDKNDLIDRFLAMFDCASAVVVDGYIITSGTGDGVFAYDPEGFEWGIKAAEIVTREKYSEFCAHCEPETDADLARVVYEETGLEICHGGTCDPVLDTDFVEIEEMPRHLRASHRAANNWGTYPHNGATRRRVTRSEAEEIVRSDDDGYDHIVAEVE